MNNTSELCKQSWQEGGMSQIPSADKVIAAQSVSNVVSSNYRLGQFNIHFLKYLQIMHLISQGS